MNKKILIIGAGYGQIPAIFKAKEIGLEVIVIDKNPYAEGMEIADFAYAIDIVDKEGALAIAKKHCIDGVMTMQSDLPVPTIGYINDHLNLNGVSLEVANFCSNKIETRTRLKLMGCSQPKFEIVRTKEDALRAVEIIGIPCVIKAPDSSGSRGVIKVKSIKEVDSAFNEAKYYSRNDSILVEEFISGLEFGAQTFSEAGECRSVLLHNDTMSPPPYMIPIGHSFPFKNLTADQKKQAQLDIKKAIEALGIKNGPANVDLILDERTNKIKIIEVGARIGATCLPELVFYHTGIDWVKATILNAIKEKVDLTEKRQTPVAAIIVESPKDGVYKGFVVDSNKNTEDILEFEITAKIDEEIHVLRKGTDRIGKVVAYGKDVNDAELIVSEFRKSVIIQVK